MADDYKQHAKDSRQLEISWPENPLSASPTQSPTPAAGDNKPPTRHHRIVARLPGPPPLATAVAKGNFGYDEENHPIRPSAEEVRAITECQVAKLVALFEKLGDGRRPDPDMTAQATSILRAYAEDFGERAALQLDAYARRQAGIDPTRTLRGLER